VIIKLNIIFSCYNNPPTTLGQALQVISPLQNLRYTVFLHNFYVEKPVDKFGDNWEKSPIIVDKWRISSVMSRWPSSLCMRYRTIYPHIHREHCLLADWFQRKDSLHYGDTQYSRN